MNTLDLLLESLIHELVLLDEGEALECRTCYLDVVKSTATALYHIQLLHPVLNLPRHLQQPHIPQPETHDPLHAC